MMRFNVYKDAPELIIEEFNGGGYENNLMALETLLNKRARQDNLVIISTRVNQKIKAWMCGHSVDNKSSQQHCWQGIWDLLDANAYHIKVAKK